MVLEPSKLLGDVLLTPNYLRCELQIVYALKMTKCSKTMFNMLLNTIIQINVQLRIARTMWVTDSATCHQQVMVTSLGFTDGIIFIEIQCLQLL